MTALTRIRRLGGVAALVSLLATAPARGVDTVSTLSGTEHRGAIVAMSPTDVEIEARGGVIKVSVTEIEEVAFDGEPEGLGGARRLIQRGDGAGAIDELAKVDPADLENAEPRIKEEMDYLRAAAAAAAAIETGKDGEAAATALADFLKKFPRSHHFFFGQELLGDLLARLGKFDDAAAAYSALDRGPPALRIRAASMKAGLLLQQGKPDKALAEFEAVAKIQSDPGDASSTRQKLEADLGRSRCLAGLGKPADAIAVGRGVIKGANPADARLLAAAYTALGGAQRAAGSNDEDALISFLTVHLVYNADPESHAEALYNLAQLWEKANKPERARDAVQMLMTTYPESSWARKLAAASGPS